MTRLPIYADNHATTRVDPRVVAAMLPLWTEAYGNAASATHRFGWAAKEAVDRSRATIAAAIGAMAKEIVFTSGATESNNLAILGVAEKLAGQGRHLISVVTEHHAVLEPLGKLQSRGFEVTRLPVRPDGDPQAGLIRIEELAAALRDDTILVSVMLANNEIGAIQPLAEIGRLCKQRGVLLHSDAAQAVGRLPVNVDQLGVDLMSFTAHKFYGPKGIGALYVRSRRPRVRLAPQIVGGGQEGGLRSGTLNVPGIVGFARAVELSVEEMSGEGERLGRLRDRLWAGLAAAVEGARLNGPALDLPGQRLSGNLNVRFPGFDGETLILQMKEVAVSAGSACTSADPQPSHVLRALGLSDEAVRSSLRFGLGRFNTEAEVDQIVARVAAAAARLRI